MHRSGGEVQWGTGNQLTAKIHIDDPISDLHARSVIKRVPTSNGNVVISRIFWLVLLNILMTCPGLRVLPLFFLESVFFVIENTYL